LQEQELELELKQEQEPEPELVQEVVVFVYQHTKNSLVLVFQQLREVGQLISVEHSSIDEHILLINHTS
jgi:hypothetical protein